MNNKPMKKAIIDQIILWIMLFIAFVTFLFFIIDYSNALKVKDNTDAITDYIARMVALGKPQSDIVSGANIIKDDYFANILDDELVCSSDSTISNHQVIVNVYVTLKNGFLPIGNNNVHSKTVVFNESSEFQKECSVTLSFN
jgi:Flp pilus assembly protein TadG